MYIGLVPLKTPMMKIVDEWTRFHMNCIHYDCHQYYYIFISQQYAACLLNFNIVPLFIVFVCARIEFKLINNDLHIP